MTPENDLHPHDDLAIYALDALDPDEHAALEEHLARCPSCRAELEEHRATLARLVVPAEEPPPSVWAGIAQQLPKLGGPAVPSATLPDADATAADGDDDRAPVVPLHAPLHARRRGFVERSGWLAAAAALVVVLGLGTLLITRGSDEPETVGDLAAAAAGAPGATIIPLADDSGHEVARVVLAADNDATDYVIFDDLAQLPPSTTYQLWETAGSVPPVSLGVLGDGSGEATAIAAPANATSLAISQEPEDGVPQPTGPIIATGTRA